MAIRTERRIRYVYVTSDGTEYDDQQKAETHEQAAALLCEVLSHCNVLVIGNVDADDVARYVVEHYTLTRKEP